MKTRFLRLFVFLAALVALSACSTSFKTGDVTPPTLQRFQSGQTVYIGISPDGSSGGEIYSGTGAEVSRYLASGLQPHSGEIIIGSASGRTAYLEQARQKNATYLFVPEIIQWEARNAPWNGISPKVVIMIRTYDVASGREVLAREISATSSTVPLVGPQASDMAKEIVTAYARSLF